MISLLKRFWYFLRRGHVQDLKLEQPVLPRVEFAENEQGFHGLIWIEWGGQGHSTAPFYNQSLGLSFVKSLIDQGYISVLEKDKLVLAIRSSRLPIHSGKLRVSGKLAIAK